MNSVALTEEVLISLLGKAEDSAEFTTLLRSLNGNPRIESFEGERKYYTFNEIGLDFVFDEGKVTGSHLFGPSADEATQPFAGNLPRTLSFADSREAVLKKLGLPNQSHPGREDPRHTARIKPWVKYAYEHHALHVRFNEDCSAIEMVTLLAS